MGMAAVRDITTIEELLALPEDGRRHELLDGEHVETPAPRWAHQFVLNELNYALQQVLHDRDDLHVLTSPADIVLSPRTLVQPDLFVVRREPGKRIEQWADVGVPILAAEVLSPSTASRDRGKKRRLYQQAGVGQYWILDCDARLVERWLPTDERPEIISDVLLWSLPGGATGEIDVADMFERGLR